MIHTRSLRRSLVTQVALAITLLLFVGLSPVQASEGLLSVYYFDVDQGDATLLKGPDFTILIDAGRHDRSEVVGLLRGAGVSSIDLFVLTHPHADHIGQCANVISSFPVREVWMSGDVHTSRTFERCIDAILETDAFYHEPRAGETFQVGSAHIDIVHPDRVTGDYNNGSLAMRVRYGQVTFLFTGDAEAEGEREMLQRGHDLTATVLHLGHHGSSTSSTLDFLRSINPEVAIYSAGVGNSYGHPHQQVLQRLAALSIPVYGTDTHGTVTVRTDGKTYTLRTQQGGSDAASHAAAYEGCAAGQININSAPVERLLEIVNVGSILAGRIIEARPFLSLDDLLGVSGIGEARLAQIRAQGLACAGPMAN